MMMRPENFYLTSKLLLGVTLSPGQLVVIQNLWKYKFPMLIASRGYGKCIDGNAYVVSDYGISRVVSLINSNSKNDKVYIKDLNLLGENGYRPVEYGWCNGFGKTIKLKTRSGYEIECTPNHPLRGISNNNINWIDADNLKIGDYLLINRNYKWFEKTNDLSVDEAYAFGLLVGNGSYTQRKYISFTTADQETLDKLNNIFISLWGKEFKKTKKEYYYHLSSVHIRELLFSKYGFASPICELKDFPKSVLSAKKDVVAAFIRGLFDTDGTVSKNGSIVKFDSRSENLVKTLHFILTMFGIKSTKSQEWNKKYERYYHNIKILGEENLRLFNQQIGFGLSRKQKRLNRFLNNISNKAHSSKDIVPRELISSDLYNLLRSYYDIVGRGGKTKILRPILHKCDKDGILKFSGMTYKRLRYILEYIKNEVSDRKEWMRLKDICDQNYIYDPIVSIKHSMNTTYDVYIPDDHSFISNGFISHNSFLVAVYSMLRCILKPGTKVVIVGNSFRQSKFIFDYVERIWGQSNILQDLFKSYGNCGPRRDPGRWDFFIGESLITAIPVGPTGEAIRGMRANVIIADEFAAQNPSVYERVISGFGAVALDPIERMKNKAKIKLAKKFGHDALCDQIESKIDIGNQNIITGTAYYHFNHFYEYYKKYETIIKSRGDKEILANLLGDDAVDTINWKHYAIIRIPYELIPDGYMDKENVARNRITMTKSTYQMEYGAVFAKDSDGFFPRSLIDRCVTRTPIKIGDESVQFDAVLVGNPRYKYVIGIDPAAETDNFAIVVLELHSNHRRIVYCWTTQKSRFKNQKASDSRAHDFHSFCVRKIRDLKRVFPTEHIVIDRGGGGNILLEGLHDPSKINFDNNETYIWETVDYNDPKESDSLEGEHIVDMFNFNKYELINEANYGLKKDLEDKRLLFPCDDAVTNLLAESKDKQRDSHKLMDTIETLETCLEEIEELKEELSTIIKTETQTGRERWDTPETKVELGLTQKKGRLRKDRYTALMIANWKARTIQKEVIGQAERDYYGGFIHEIQSSKIDGSNLYSGPDWYNKGMQDFI